MKIVKELINFIKKIIIKLNLFIIPIIIFLFVGLFFIKILFGIIGAKYAEKVEIEVYGPNNIELEQINFYRISLNNNKTNLKLINNKWIEVNKYFTGIEISLDKNLINKVLKIIIKIKDKNFELNNNSFFIQSNFINEQYKDNNIIVNYKIPASIYYEISKFDRLNKIINWAGDNYILKKEIISTIIIIILFPLLLIIFLITFFIIIGLFNNLIELFSKINIDIKKFLFFILIIFISFTFVNNQGVSDVKNSWIQGWWMNNYITYGFIKGYEQTGDNYPPLSFIIIGFTKIISDLLKIDILLIYKSILLIFLIISSIILYLWTKDLIISALLYLSLSIATVSHGYLDILYTPFLILSFYFLYKQKLLLFTIFFAISCLIKYQPLIIAPFILIYLLNISSIKNFNKINFKQLSIKIFIPAFLIIIIFFIIFGPHLFISLIKGTQHSALSADALNFNWIYTYFLHILLPHIYGPIIKFNYVIEPQSSIITLFPKILFILSFFISLYYFFKIKEKKLIDLILYSIIGYLSYFIFNIGVHQNHLFPLIILFSILVFFDKKYYLDFCLFSIIFNINIIIFYGITGQASGFEKAPYGFDLTLILSIIILIIYLNFYFSNILYKKKDNYELEEFF